MCNYAQLVGLFLCMQVHDVHIGISRLVVRLLSNFLLAQHAVNFTAGVFRNMFADSHEQILQRLLARNKNKGNDSLGSWKLNIFRCTQPVV